MFKLYINSSFYTGYFLSKKSLKDFIKKKPSIIKQLEKCMSDDMTNIFKEKIEWNINSWIKSPRISNPQYIILTNKRNYVASLRYHYEITNKLYNLVKVNKDKYLLISLVLVNPEFRGNGICTNFLNYFVTNNKYDNVLRVLKTNEAAKKCYEKVGFSLIDFDKTDNIYIYPKLPNKYVVSKKDVVLGATTGSGFSKVYVGKKTWNFGQKPQKGEILDDKNGELLAVLNNHKPLAIRDINRKLKQIKEEKPLYNYLHKKNLYYIYPPTGDKTKLKIIILWSNPEYEKNAFLLEIFDYKSYLPKKERKWIDLEVNKLNNQLQKNKIIESLIRFRNHYINGKLLGYRESEIRGYFISNQLWIYVYNHFRVDNHIDMKLLDKFKKKSLEEKFKILKREKRKYVKSNEYKIFTRQYPLFTKICHEWLTYMLTKSKPFNKYYIKNKSKMHILYK